MQFKYPEILFFLFLLLIPILIHLFHLRRFKKENFTNVKFLREIDLETRKSSRLKKLLILFSRILALAALIIAFSQPFINKNKDLQIRESIIYLDNSLSLQATGNSGIDKFQSSKNHLLEILDDKDKATGLISNEKQLNQLDNKSLNKELISLEFHPIKKDINQILLQINNYYKNLTETLLDVYLISDFQKINGIIDTGLISNFHDYNIIDLSDRTVENISLDTVWMAKNDGKQIVLKALISSWKMSVNDLSISLFINEKLYGKTTVNIEKGSKREIEFLIPSAKSKYGKISLTDHRLNFDNELYFNIPQRPKKKVLIIGVPTGFLERIYQEDEFSLTKSSYAELDQSIISSHDLIILNELDKISKPLSQSLQSFVRQKGNLVIIPSDQIDLDTYNDLFSSLNAGLINGSFKKDKSINRINYDHPFFDKVFEKEVYNFQYPTLSQGFTTNLRNASHLLQFDDLTDFVSEISYYDNKVYWIASPLSIQANKFVNSPLIVPLFYNFSIQNKNDDALFLSIGQLNEVIAYTDDSDDSPLKIVNGDNEFIPMQTKSGELIKVTTEEFPLKSGIYELQLKGQLLQRLAFNYDRIESDLNFNDFRSLTDEYQNIHLYNSLEKALKEGNDRNINKDLWQLFIIFALVFLILEILLQKFLKN